MVTDIVYVPAGVRVFLPRGMAAASASRRRVDRVAVAAFIRNHPRWPVRQPHRDLLRHGLPELCARGVDLARIVVDSYRAPAHRARRMSAPELLADRKNLIAAGAARANLSRHLAAWRRHRISRLIYRGDRARDRGDFAAAA